MPSPSSGQTYGNPVNERGQSYRPATQKEVPDFQPQFRRQGSLPSLAGDRTKQSRKEKPKHLEKNNLDENSNKGGNLKQKDKKETKIEKQAKSNVQETKTNIQKADLDTDEWQQVFTFLLREFDGQTKFGTLMSKKDQLLKGLNHAEAAEWLKRNSSKFLVFEKEGKIKYVSVFFRSAKLCFNHRNPEYISCRNEKCTFFHVCRDFISGSCPRGTDCRFSHNFHSPTNQKVCHELGLQNFTNDDIRKIILCSNPSVCEKYNRSGCNGDDCLHLHVCAEHVQQKCTAGESCKKSHSVKSIEHNQWVLKTFNLAHLPEGVLNKMLIIKRDSEKKSGPDAKQKQFTKSKPPKESKGIVMTNPPQELERQGEELSSSPLFLPDNPTEGGEQGQDNNEGSDKGKKQLPTPRKSKKSRGQKIKIPNSAQGEPEDEAGRGHQGQQDTWIAKGDPDAGDDENQFEADIPSVPQTFTNNPALEIEDVEGVQGQQHASQYAYLCEMYSCTGDCPTGFLCPYYHHRRKIMYQWQIYLFECWYDFSETDSYDIERCFCTLSVQETFEVVLEGIGELRLTIDFDAMEATVEDSFGGSVVSSDQVPVQRWSTRSYIEADPAATLSYYTQWIWYCQDDTGCFLPFNPERLQYTLEEKYVRGQQKYYYEQDNARFVLHFNERGRVNLDNHSISRVMRRPVFIESHETTAPVMSELLLLEKPTLQHPVQLNWNCVDKYQDFELLELDATGAEFQDVAIKFHASLDRRNETILTIFRIQNPALWDTYCSKKRAMTPRDMTDKDVDERQLFHGTPTLDAVRGIAPTIWTFEDQERMLVQNMERVLTSLQVLYIATVTPVYLKTHVGLCFWHEFWLESTPLGRSHFLSHQYARV
ncbi:uncharacterized protein LOC112557291 [Pomacea canaliculata]|uniref:uncharacterized protein LOC112557291 n=1 Tax=Pomacea canaliculata TaxID=400727 RepID=UPI000D734E60|nr:uncharacterized protein LOC112557291 [Pomacea canaliculata]